MCISSSPCPTKPKSLGRSLLPKLESVVPKPKDSPKPPPKTPSGKAGKAPSKARVKAPPKAPTGEPVPKRQKK